MKKILSKPFQLVFFIMLMCGNNGHAQRIGDPMPFYDAASSKFYLYYLKDIWNDETNKRHPWNALTTTDLSAYTEIGEKLSCSADPCKQDFAIGTGSVIKEGSIYYAFYTGHNPNYPSLSCTATKEGVMMATSTSLNGSFTKSTSFTTIYPPSGYDPLDNFRDPYVYKEGNTFYMIVSARTSVNGTWRGVLAKYTSTNLTSWDYAGVLYDGGNTNFFMMECAEIFKIGTTYYLIFSDTNTKNVYYRKSLSINGPWSNPEGVGTLTGVGYAARTASNGTERYIWGWQAVGNTWAGEMIHNQLLQGSNGDLIVTSIGNNVAVTGVSVTPTTATISVSSSQQLTATIAPSNATNKTVSWSSSNTSIATVNSSGLVTAVTVGSATITVTTQDGNKTATCAITVISGSTGSSGISSGLYRIVSTHSGKAIDASGSTNGSLVQQWEYLGGANQKWKITESSDPDYYTITALNSGKVLDADGATNGANGTKIQVWSGLSGDNQKWQMVSVGNGSYKILCKNGGRAIEIIGSSMNNGEKLQLKDFTGATNQQWYFELMSSQSSRVAQNTQPVTLNNFSVYPNPVENVLHTNYEDSFGKVLLYIFDNVGRLVLSKEMSGSNYDLDVSGLRRGVYFVYILADSYTITNKLVKN